MENKKRMKMAIIAGASHAFKFREEHPEATEEQVLQYITREAGKILEGIDEED